MRKIKWSSTTVCRVFRILDNDLISDKRRRECHHRLFLRECLLDMNTPMRITRTFRLISISTGAKFWKTLSLMWKLLIAEEEGQFELEIKISPRSHVALSRQSRFQT